MYKRQVWGLIGNTQDASVSVHDVLSNTASGENLVNQLISTAIQYNLDGINVDFEGLAGRQESILYSLSGSCQLSAEAIRSYCQ